MIMKLDEGSNGKKMTSDGEKIEKERAIAEEASLNPRSMVTGEPLMLDGENYQS